ncbi:MAG TPA: cytochrome B, partial [Rhodospirillales bacterium]|nr:cytochrome B [Rhodospirillales bacterium]
MDSRIQTELTSQTTRVWDLPLRLFHWAMVPTVIVVAVTGFLAPQWWLGLHSIAGYALGVLLAFRLLWGVVGSPYSRFSSFPLKPGAVYQHLLSVLHRTPQVIVGHNP